MGLNDLHFVQSQGQNPLFADPHQLFVGNLKVDQCHFCLAFAGYFRHKKREAAFGHKFSSRKYSIALDQGVAEQSGGNALHIGQCKLPLQQVLN